MSLSEQPFERHTALASWIERLANSQSGLSLGEWMIFLGSLNHALNAARAEGVAALQQAAEPVADILIGLDMIRRQADYWVSYNTEKRAREGLSSDDDTHLISPPWWPSHGQLKAWSDVLAKAGEALSSLPQQTALVEQGVEE